MYQLGKRLADPYCVVTLFLGLSIAVLWLRRRETRRGLLALTLAYLALVVLSLPVTGQVAL